MLLTVPILYYKAIQEQALKIEGGRQEGGGGKGGRFCFIHV